MAITNILTPAVLLTVLMGVILYPAGVSSSPIFAPKHNIVKRGAGLLLDQNFAPPHPFLLHSVSKRDTGPSYHPSSSDDDLLLHHHDLQGLQDKQIHSHHGGGGGDYHIPHSDPHHHSGGSDYHPHSKPHKEKHSHHKQHYHKPGKVGPVYTFVKTDYDANVKWGVRHRVGAQYGR